MKVFFWRILKLTVRQIRLFIWQTKMEKQAVLMDDGAGVTNA